MSSWAERVHKRAADLGSVVTSCGHPGTSTPSYPYRLEKVKFGVALEEVCKNDNIPGPLLVLILKLNKESPNRRDVFRAPGHQGAMKKLIHFLQAGRLVNVDNYSVYTIASVLKKFLRKIPNGIFGRSGEKELFAIIELDNEVEQTDRLHRLFTSLPKYTQHLLVLLFGTFRVIASNAAPAATGMTSEALGVSVAPSFFQSCVSDGKTARMEDVLKFKVATKIMKHIIDKFATNDLFGRENYEYYARVTGRILKVQDEWICSFQYPPPPRGKLAQQKYALQHSLEAEKTWLQCQCERWGLLAQEESRSTPALLTSSSSAVDNSVLSLGVSPEHSFIESCARLSVSLEGPGLFAMTSSPLPKRNSIRGDEVFMVQHRRMQRDIEDDDFTIGEGELDYDESNYGDDDDDDDGGEITGAINRDYENYGKNVCLNDSGLIEKQQQQQQQRQLKMTPKPKPTLSSKKKQIRKAALAVGSTAAAAAGVGIGLNEVERIAYGNAKNVGDDNDDDDDGDGDVDGDDDDDAMITANKRRYRQNKKTTTQARNLQQHARRLRAGSKSLDGTATAIEMKSQAKAHAQAQRNMDSIAIKSKSSQAKTKPMKQPKASAQAGGTTKPPPAAAAAAAGAGALTTTATTASSGVGAGSGSLRTCSRCNRGIRHSSSCSSASGGAGNGAGNNPNGGNNSGMTMEELRAVNRYAESTKSLSYLPQVHERQTARMHTRSEWFLSGGDGIGDGMTLQLPIACSNCCLYATEECYQQQVEEHKQERERKQRQHDGQQEKQQQLLQQQQQQQQQKTYYFPHNYLGGGSTRDMRPRADEYEDDAFFLFHKQRHHNQQHQQKQQQQQQRQQLQCNIPLQLNSLADVYIDAPGITCCSESNDFHMDTDENIAINHQQQQQLHQQDDNHQQQKQKQQQQQQQRMQQNLMLSANFSHSTSTKATTATYLLKPTTTTTTTTTKTTTTTTTTTGTGVCNLSSSLDGSSEANSTNPQSNSKATNIEIDDAFIGYQQRSNVLMDTRIVSNIRLSNSAESVQCPSRRPATVRRLIGHSNIPRQYPLRASLRRNKEKQIGSGGNGNSGGGSNSNSNSNINSGCKNSTNNLNNNKQNTNNFTNNKNDSNSNSNMNNNNHNSGSKNCNVVIPSNNGNHHSDNNTSMFVADDIRINRTLGFGTTNQPPSVRNSIAECYGNILAPTLIGNRLEPKRAVSLKTTYVDATENVAKTIVDIADNNRLLNYTTAQFGNIIPPIASSTTNTSTSINTNTNMERNSTMPTFVRQRNNTTIPTPPIISSTITSPLITTTALATEKTVYSKQQQQQSSSAMEDPDEMKTTISNTVTFKTPRV